jgi:hypothetical protein
MRIVAMSAAVQDRERGDNARGSSLHLFSNWWDDSCHARQVSNGKHADDMEGLIVVPRRPRRRLRLAVVENARRADLGIENRQVSEDIG